MRATKRLACLTLLLLSACSDWYGSGNAAIPLQDYYGSQTIGGSSSAGPPTGSAGGNAIH